jgi:hypothetical protein
MLTLVKHGYVGVVVGGVVVVGVVVVGVVGVVIVVGTDVETLVISLVLIIHL